MFTRTKAKHAKKTLLQKSTSLGLVGILVSASLVATVTASQGAPVESTIYCGVNSIEVATDINGANPNLVANEVAPEQGLTAYVTLASNDFTDQMVGNNSGTVYFSNTDEAPSSAEVMSVFREANGGVTVQFYLDVNKDAADVWPITLENNFGNPTQNIENQHVDFYLYSPCNGTIEDASTEYNDDSFGWWEQNGNIRVLGDGVYQEVWANTVSKTTVRKSVLDGVTTFSYDTERISDAAGGVMVNITHNVKFAGNTVTWSVEAFDLSTSEPAGLTFYLEGALHSGSRTEVETSNGLTYSSDGFYRDAILVYAAGSGTTTRFTDDTFRFSAEDVNSGFVEVSVLGYDRCATESEIVAAIDAFTDDYANSKNTDIPDKAGAACNRVCQPSTATLERSPGVFDLGGVPLCFDTAFQSTDGGNPQTLLEQEVRASVDELPDFGSNMVERDYVDYQNVAMGGDTILNATVTISTLYRQDDDEIDDVDDGVFRYNAWIHADIDYNEGEEDRYIELTIEFYVSGDVSRTPVRVSNLGLDAYDIDNYQFIAASGVDTYSLAEDTILQARPNGSQLRVSENNGEGSSNEDDSRASILFKPADSFVLRLGVTDGESGSGGASYGLDFTGLTGWESAPVEEVFKPGRGGTGAAAALPAPTTKFVAKRTISRFSPESPRLLKAQKATIRAFLKKNPEITNISCTGYTAGPVKRSHKALAKKRATNVCAYIERIKPAVVTKVVGKTPGLPFSPLSRKVVIRGSSVTP